MLVKKQNQKKSHHKTEMPNILSIFWTIQNKHCLYYEDTEVGEDNPRLS